ncbi:MULTISPECIES: hypothetical protein [unclassified Streptomyces]|uniref:MmpS family membrane protein n=2 Tax=unclassified Streptomyces TaxID=2593676 RepID=A0A6G3QSU8_9ACTN|nr:MULTISPECIES: hypothetical protein [unclassified Streptomyces]NEA86546.1 hypothetical protein [Streptomyces sp. SID14436]NEC82181.1 hypothetical protein [Streptomyces sp. SID7958]
MRRARTIIALVAAAGLLTACGGSGDDDRKPAADGQGAAASSAPAADGQDEEKEEEKGTDGGDRADTTYEVTLEVGGSGGTSVYYVLGTNRTEQVSLPWKKSDSITLNSTQRKVGTIVSVVPGPVTQSDGRLAAAPCSITVDGKKVVDDPGGAEGKHICQYTLH